VSAAAGTIRRGSDDSVWLESFIGLGARAYIGRVMQTSATQVMAG
jgi:hypothetical protein